MMTQVSRFETTGVSLFGSLGRLGAFGEDSTSANAFFVQFHWGNAEKLIVRKANFIFILFCMVLTVALVQARFLFEKTFGDEKFLRTEMSRLQEKREVDKIEVAKLQNQLLDMESHVAVLPGAGSWAKSLRAPASEDAIDLSGVKFEEANRAFKTPDYRLAIKHFQSYVRDFPAGPKIVDAYFLLAESYFRVGDLQECLEVVDFMVTQFPENELTGFIMLRMGQVFQARNRLEEAIEVYQIVEEKFRGSEGLKQQAQNLLRAAQRL